LTKQLHDSVQGLMELEKKGSSDSSRPAATNLASAQSSEQGNIDKRSQLVQVPIDEVEAIGLKVSPTYKFDDVLSVTLKSFRKIVGFDTFDSILKQERSESKDPADYYNVTVSMMIKRNPEEVKKAVQPEKFEGGKTLSKVIDKGFPYDDSDISTDERATPLKSLTVGKIVGQLNGENVTSQSLKNLVTDRTMPVTLAQVSSKRSDGDILSALLGENVTRGALKNLVTDKPAPITTPLSLAQRPAYANLVQIAGNDGDVLSALLGENVTRGALKNLVTDKPAPITTPLSLAQMENPVVNPPFNNWSVNQPSPAHDSGLEGTEDLKLRNIIIDGVDGYNLAQQKAVAHNPVYNPPFNNWSVNQPSPPHAQGLNGKADLGQNIIVDGSRVRFSQQHKLAQIRANPNLEVYDDGLAWRETVPGDFTVKDKTKVESTM